MRRAMSAAHVSADGSSRGVGGHVGEVRHDHVSARRAQRIGVARAVHADHMCETATSPRFDPRKRILHHDRPFRGGAELLRSLQEDGWIRLAEQSQPASHEAIDLHGEERTDARRTEDRAGVLAGRDDRGADAELLQAANQPDGALEGLDAVALDLIDEVAVLAVAEPADRLHIW